MLDIRFYLFFIKKFTLIYFDKKNNLLNISIQNRLIFF